MSSGPVDRPRWPVVAVVAVYFVSFATWALATPVMGVPDEPAHAIKAASVWRGDLRGTEVEVDSGNPTIAIPISMDRVEVPESYAGLSGVPLCYAFYNVAPASCSQGPGSGMEPEEAMTSAGVYSPVFYAVVGWPSRFFGADVGVYLMRLTAALWSALLMGLGFAALRVVVRADFAFLALVLAATPMAHFLAGSVNPNGVEVAAAVAFWCTALALARTLGSSSEQDPGRWLFVGFVLSGGVLALLRPLSPLFAVLILGSSVVVQGPSAMRRIVRSRSAWLTAGALAVPIALAVAWNLGPGRANSFFGPTPPPDRSLLTVLGGLVDEYFQQAVAFFGWKDTGPVLQAIVPWLLAVAALSTVALLFGRPWSAWVLLAVVAGSVLMPVVVQWPTARTQGLAWQGRYQLPLISGIPIVAAVVADSWARSAWRPSRRMVWAGTVVGGFVLVASHLVVMQRNVVGTKGPVNYLMADQGWLESWQRWGLLVLTLLVAASLPLLGGFALRSQALAAGERNGDGNAHRGDRVPGSARNGGDDPPGGTGPP